MEPALPLNTTTYDGQDGYIDLLPALPDAWKDGSFKGLRVRGGAEADAIWSNKQLTTVTLQATSDNTFRVKVPEHAISILHNNKEIPVEDGFVSIKMNKGDIAKLDFSSH